MKRLVVLLALWPGAVWAEEPSVLVATEMPRQGSVPHTLTAYGVMQAAPGGSQALSLLRGGQVGQVLVTVGQRVRQGDVLLSVSADAAALAAYQQAVAAVALARGEQARAGQMLAQHLATRDQLAQADKAAADAQANLAVLDRAGGGSAAQSLVAPFDGVVSALAVASGARVAAQAPLVTIDRASRVVAAVGVEPAERGLVAGGQAAELQPLYGGAALAGRVVTVGAMLDPASRLVPVLVEPAAGAGAVLQGEPVRAVVQVGAFEGWIVPRDAVPSDAKGAHVFQVKAGHAVRVDVRVVGKAGAVTVVAGALDPARKLVIRGGSQLQGEEAVREEAVGKEALGKEAGATQ